MAAITIGQGAGSRSGYDKALTILHRFIRDNQGTRTEATRALDYLEKKFMKVGEVQRILGVKSPTTVKKWLDRGRFPGAYQTESGQWMFPAERVYELRDASIRARQEALLPGPTPIEAFEGEDPMEAFRS